MFKSPGRHDRATTAQDQHDRLSSREDGLQKFWLSSGQAGIRPRGSFAGHFPGVLSQHEKG